MLKSKKIIALLVSLVLILPYSSVKAKDQTADELYANAYNSVVACQREKTQQSINIARDSIKKLKNTKAQFAMGEFSKLVDHIQEDLFKEFMEIIFDNGKQRPYDTVSQDNINKARDLVNSFASCEENKIYVKAWSSKIDEYQNYYIKDAVKLFEIAIESGYEKDVEAAKERVEGLLTARNNVTVFQFAIDLMDKLNLASSLEKIGPALVSGVKLNYSVTEPMEFGAALEANFINNTSYTIVGFEAVAKLKDRNDLSYMVCNHTVLPKEKSPNMTAVGPDSGKEEDVEVISYKITVADNAGNEYVMDYDVASKGIIYSYSKSRAIVNPLVKVSELPISLKITEPNEYGVRSLSGTYVNNSKYKIRECRYTLLYKDTNLLTEIQCEQEVLPGQKSGEFITFSPKNEKIESVEILKWHIIVVDEKGNEISMTYDVKRDMYF